MNIGAIIGLYFLVQWLTQGRWTGGSGKPGVFASTLIAPLVLWLVALVAAGLLRALFGAWGDLLAVVLVGPVLFPWWSARFIFVPLGMARSAAFIASLSQVLWGVDPRGAGLVAAARALGRQRSPSVADVAWLEERVVRVRPVRPGAVLATAIVADLRGDRRQARSLMRAVGWFRDDVLPPEAWRMSREWLSIDAAAAGDWEAAREFSRSNGTRSAVAALIHGIVRALGDGPDRPSTFELGWLWLLAGRHVATRGFVGQVAERRPPPVRPIDEGLAGALAEHARVAAMDSPSAAELVALTAAWNQVLRAPAIAEHLERRAAQLGARSGALAVAVFSRQVGEDLAALAEAAGVPLRSLPAGPVIDGVRGAARDAALREASVLADRLRARELEGAKTVKQAFSLFGVTSDAPDGPPDLPQGPLEDLRAFLALHDAFERLGGIGGPSLQRLAFRDLNDAMSDVAVRLFNREGERPLGNAMMHRMLEMAETVGDQVMVGVQARNVRIGL